MTERRATVVVVDDSAVVRKLLAEALNKEQGIEVVGTAVDPFVARDLILRHEPDFITLDIEMPRMDGLSFLERLMTFRPMPVIVVSSISQRGSAASVEALRLGAVDVIPKPEGPGSVGAIAATIARKIREFRGSTVSLGKLAVPRATVKPEPSRAAVRGGNGLILIGASTGGTQAIESVLTRLPIGLPPIVIVQHMPPGFTRAFANRLNGVCAIEVVEAQGQESLKPGMAYIAPGDRHLVVQRTGVVMKTALLDGPPIHYQRPAVDALFQSVAALHSVPIVAAILTGMGRDGAAGLLALRNAGAETIAEDERSCVVFGMPREAIALGAARHVATLLDMPDTILGSWDRVAASRRPS